MTETIRHIKPSDRIESLYKRNDQSTVSNIIDFTPPLSVKSLEIIDDVSAFLENPDTRMIAEDILSEAIYEIAAKLSNNR